MRALSISNLANDSDMTKPFRQAFLPYCIIINITRARNEPYKLKEVEAALPAAAEGRVASSQAHAFPRGGQEEVSAGSRQYHL